MKKTTLLLIIVFALTAATLSAQERVTRDGLSQLLHQLYFSDVPVNEFNQVFQNYLRLNYPGKNIFNAAEVKEITTGFVLSVLINDTLSEKKGKNDDTPEQKAGEFVKSGDEYRRRGDNDRAIADYTQAIRLNPDNDLAYINRAEAYKSKGDWNRAIADYTEAVRIYPDENIYILRAEAYIVRSNFTQARADVNKVLKLNPNSQKAKDLEAELKKKGY